jgi:predicted HTH transcriptional regulator
MPKQFRVTFVADEAKLPTIVSCLIGEVSSFAVVDVDQEEPKKAQYKPRRPVDDWPTSRLILEAIREKGRVTTHDLEEVFLKEGFSASTPSTVLFHLTNAGIVRRIGSRGSYSYEIQEERK